MIHFLRPACRPPQSAISSIILTRAVLLAVAVILPAAAQVATTGLSGGDEFVGPFQSWANAKTAFGAVADGVADDTTALQNGLNSLGQAGRSSVLYLPAGTYRITSGLTLAARQGVSIIGEDPSRTIIKWDGALNGEMLYLNAVSYSRMGRITWDGAGKALAGVDHGWDGQGTRGGGTYNEHADEIFENLTYGIRGGSKGFMDAETAVLRCQFIHNSRAGVSIESYNALDWYIWDSTFTNNYIGVTNIDGAGNFHVRGSLFQASTKADIAISSVSFFSIRQNFSIGSNAFFTADKIGSSSAQITLQSNTILDPVTTPIVIYNPGPVLMFDNTIRSSAGQTGPVVTIQDIINQSPGQLVAIGNTFTVSNWNAVTGTVTDLDNQVVSRTTLNPATPSMPPALPNLNRHVAELPAGASADAIQSAIDAAMALNGQRPVVHFPAGVYSLSRSVVVPSASDVQLIGDGGGNAGATHLQWQGTGGGPVLRLAGPSRATVRDLDVQGGTQSTAILVENADQAGSRVFMEQIGAQNQQTGVLVNGLDNGEVRLHDGYVAYNNLGIKVIGGSKAAAGQTVGARTDMFAGLTASNTLTYDLATNGRLMSQDVWYEGAAAQLLNFTGSGTFTLHGAMIGAQDAAHGGVQTNVPTVQINNFKGSVSLLGTQLQVRNSIGIQGTSAAINVLALGIVGPSDIPNFFVNSASGDQAGLISSRQTQLNAGSIPVTDQTNVSSVPAFLRQMLTQTRQEQARPLSVPGSGITDARLYRVSVSQGQTGIEVAASGPASTSAPLISGVSSSVTGPTSASVVWNTNEVADSQVEYGTTTSYGLLNYSGHGGGVGSYRRDFRSCPRHGLPLSASQPEPLRLRRCLA